MNQPTLNITSPELIVVRHGQSLVNEARRSHGNDSEVADRLTAMYDNQEPLSDLGRSQAATTGMLMREMVELGEIRPQIGLVSSYTRARETARLLGLEGIEFNIHDGLREFDGGHNGQPREDWSSVAGRVSGLLTEAMQDNPHKRLIVVTHSGVLGVILGLALGGVSDYEELKSMRKGATGRQKPANCEIDHYQTTVGGRIRYRSIRAWRDSTEHQIQERACLTRAAQDPVSRWSLIADGALNSTN